ncbi:MAG TPA: hypothetical protein VMI11_01865 [Actinomycetes bacterium]|nr:hypothetical protein [Actinomycetes bacterium]
MNRTRPATAIKGSSRPVDECPMDTCVRCGAGLPAGAAWCSLCHTPRGAAPAAAPAPTRANAPVPAALVQRTRYGHSEVTFGLTGRIVMTVLLLAPLGLFAFAIAAGFGIVGMGIWAVVVVPWGLRDIWKSSHRRGLTSAVPPPAVSAERFGGGPSNT